MSTPVRPTLVALALLGACDEAATPGAIGPPPSLVQVDVPLQEGPTVAFDLGVDLTYCASTVRCERELLFNPFTGRKGPSLVLAFTCRGDRGTSANAFDVFQGIERRMTCFDAGDPADPTTWSPAAGHEVVPLREEVRSGLLDPFGDAQFNLAVLPLEVNGYAFCRYEAWGVFEAAPLTQGEREATHEPGAMVVRWDVFLASRPGGDVECHLDEGEPSVMQVGDAIAVTYGLPTPTLRGQYPRVQDYAVTLGTRQKMAVGDEVVTVHGLQIAYSLDAAFPSSTDLTGLGFRSRDLWFHDAESGGALDVAAGYSCITRRPDGEVDTIAIEVLDWWARVPIGAVIVHDTLGDERFECDRDPETGACRLVPPEEVDAIAPCLHPVRTP